MDLSEINVTKAKEKQFNSKGIYSVEDLLRYLPRKYYDFTTPISLDDYKEKEMCAIVGDFLDFRIASKCIYATIRDDISMKMFRVVWFNQSYLAEKLDYMCGCKVIVCGVVSYNEVYDNLSINNPIIFSDQIEENKVIYPVYSKISGMADKYLLSTIETALSIVDKTEPYDDDILNTFHLVKEYEMYQKIHRPKTIEDIQQGKYRLVFEKLYKFSDLLEQDAVHTSSVSPYIIHNLEKTNSFIASLPYKLTIDQQKVLDELVETAKVGKHINALVQGDVGCGKTIVAFILMMAMADNGYQSILMTPTSVLAEQHYKELSGYAESVGFKAAFFTPTLKAKERRLMLEGIKNGTYDFVVGTHAVLNKDVVFKNLGLTVVDEEHKFGVEQRIGVLKESGTHSVTMSATPIPRTLALSTYGKATSIHTIESMPNGRLPVKTGIYSSDKNIFQFMINQIKEGRQCYIVCPLKNENEKLEDVESVQEVYSKALHFFDGTGIRTEFLTGGMTKEQTEDIIGRFTRNETQVLIATTIIEVGVNVPNASVITIRNAERFGLATLHQLRGRVGRGSYQSYCILQSTDKENERLKAMVETTSGFEIAKKDLEIRGSGDFIGTKQSGENECVMLMLSYPKLYARIEKYVEDKYKKSTSLIY